MGFSQECSYNTQRIFNILSEFNLILTGSYAGFLFLRVNSKHRGGTQKLYFIRLNGYQKRGAFARGSEEGGSPSGTGEF